MTASVLSVRTAIRRTDRRIHRRIHGAISANFDDERIRVRCPAVLDITFSEGEQVSRKRWTVDVHVAPACLGPASATAYDSAEFDCWLQALAWPEAGGNSL